MKETLQKGYKYKCKPFQRPRLSQHNTAKNLNFRKEKGRKEIQLTKKTKNIIFALPSLLLIKEIKADNTEPPLSFISLLYHPIKNNTISEKTASFFLSFRTNEMKT